MRDKETIRKKHNQTVPNNDVMKEVYRKVTEISEDVPTKKKTMWETVKENRVIVVVLWYIIMNYFNLPGMLANYLAQSSLVNQWVMAVSQFVTMVIAVGLWQEELSRGLKSLEKQWKKIILLLPVIPSVYLINGAISEFLLNGGTSANQESVEVVATQGVLFLTFMTIGVFTPIIEEIIYREAIIQTFNYRGTRVWGILLSMVVFIYAHVAGDLQAAVLYLPLTLSFTGAYLFFGDNVTASILLHIVNNVASLILITRI